MREFIYFSNKARTTGNFDTRNLMDAGRMDIACHILINAFFLSHKIRDDTKLHLVFNGAPDPPKHISIFPAGKKSSGNITISKKDVANLIKKLLFKYRPGKNTIVEPGYEIEKKSLFTLVDELINQGKEIYVLDDRGEDIRKIEFKDNPVFIIGDNDGFNTKELKKLKSLATPISVGKKVYFASQVVTIINNELDYQNI